MEFDISGLNAGITPNGIHHTHEAKVLVCYLLSASPRPLSKKQIQEIFDADGLVNYFTFVETISELKSSGHITVISGQNQDEIYRLEKIGHETADNLGKTLPLSVREKVVNTAMRTAWITDNGEDK